MRRVAGMMLIMKNFIMFAAPFVSCLIHTTSQGGMAPKTFIYRGPHLTITMKNTLRFLLILMTAGLCGTVHAQPATELTNLVIFLRFADDPEITHSFADIDTMFNGKAPDCYSVYNFFKEMTYDKIHFNTVYTNNIQNGVIVSYCDIHPRGYYEPYSPTNPEGYTGSNPFMGVSMREAELLGRAVRYVDSLHLVDNSVVLDGDGDGKIDNISFIVKGGVGAWASILWPHMEFFPHDSLDYVVTLNGIRPYTFNFEFEGAGPSYFRTDVFRHEMGHSLGLPDLYHYINYQSVSPAGLWDMMDNNYAPNQISAIYKNKILHVADEPVQITEDGDYTLLSAGSSPTQSCYYIKSAIDPTQWYVLEYRNWYDPFEAGLPGCGLVIGRWNDTVPLNYDGMFANAFFDFYNQAHQYWVFRPGSSDDMTNGDIWNAHFSQASGRTSFGPGTDPHPFLTDGTPENSFEITNITENGNELTFHVHFFNSGVDEPLQTECLTVYPNPAHDYVSIDGLSLSRLELYNTVGQLILAEEIHDPHHTLVLSSLPAGSYLLKIIRDNGTETVRKLMKR